MIRLEVSDGIFNWIDAEKILKIAPLQQIEKDQWNPLSVRSEWMAQRLIGFMFPQYFQTAPNSHIVFNHKNNEGYPVAFYVKERPEQIVAMIQDWKKEIQK